MDTDDIRTLSRVLVYGTAETRRALALRLAANPGAEMSEVLLSTLRSDESEVLRERCLEVLAIMAEAGHGPASGVLTDMDAAD